MKEYYPWPGLIIRPKAKPGPASPAAPSHNLGFSPIAAVMFLSQEGAPDLLEKSAATLAERCRAELEGPG